MSQRVAIPDALSAGVLDLRDYGEGLVEVDEDDDGRYVDVDSDGAAEAVADAYDGAYIRGDDGDEAEAETDDGPEYVDKWHRWNREDWLALDYKQRAEDVREGRVDEHFGKILQIETSETVKDAVAERREAS